MANSKQDEAAQAALQAGAAAQAETAEKEQLKKQAAARETHAPKSGNVIFEYSVNWQGQKSEIIAKGLPGEPPIYGAHTPIIRNKGARESLPRPDAERMQRQGLGKILDEDDPYVVRTMADVVNRDPLAPRKPEKQDKHDGGKDDQ